jgi:hypothetical protein
MLLASRATVGRAFSAGESDARGAGVKGVERRGMQYMDHGTDNRQGMLGAHTVGAHA